MSSDPCFQADMCFQKQADTLSTKTGHGNYNKKQCSAKAKEKTSLSERMMEQEEWHNNRQGGGRGEGVKSIRNWKIL